MTNINSESVTDGFSKTKNTKKKPDVWVSYGRVSSYQQVKDGNGLPCQKKRCSEYANDKGHKIEQFFGDEGVSGGTKDRPGLKELFNFISKNKDKKITIVCEDMNRLARDMLVYLSLKLEFERLGVKIFYVNQEIDDSPQGRIVEQMFMMIAQFFREENKARVFHRQKSRLEDGYWCHGIPKGYKWSSNKKGGKRLLLDEHNCYIIKEALEKYSEYELKTITDVAEFLHKRGLNVGGYKTAMTRNYKYQNVGAVTLMLCNVLYAGYVDMPEWGIHMVKGKHKALITLAVHKKILRRIEEMRLQKGYIKQKMVSSMNRIDRTSDFPLRGVLYCEESNSVLSGGFSKGRHGNLFPYYTYSIKSPMKNKVIAREQIHGEFEDLLKRIQPNERLIKIFQDNLIKQIELKEKDKDLILSGLKENLNSVKDKIQRYVERIGKTENDDIVYSYEVELKKLYIEKEQIIDLIEIEKNKVGNSKKIDFEQIRDVLHLRKNGNIDEKKKLISSIFPEGIPVTPERHLGTPKLSLPFHLFEVGKNDESKMVELIGQNINQLY